MTTRVPLPNFDQRRRIGMRLWLGVAFAVVGLITAASVYLLVRDSSGRTLSDSSAELAVGRTVRLADSISAHYPNDIPQTLEGAGTDGFNAWVIGKQGKLLSPDLTPEGQLYSEQ